MILRDPKKANLLRPVSKFILIGHILFQVQGLMLSSLSTKATQIQGKILIEQNANYVELSEIVRDISQGQNRGFLLRTSHTLPPHWGLGSSQILDLTYLASGHNKIGFCLNILGGEANLSRDLELKFMFCY